MAKTHQTGGAHQQLQAERKDRKNHDLGDKVNAVTAADQRVKPQRHKGRDGK